ncbi:hypothetical protein [Robiginitalea biformata]|uniref:Uncharacterized protein n=1 Tax=Robiginitalea biformata (strain ATCC BAA-864 / DSM 15991 / KCTC 12146 / HTCC2501) TaxID=313596 RepID=A4CP56_ROBBH|nr:hypothetical protein [Robiginitalea biformata]EAR14673.1 hypothetical protein RB2501_01316 [Robiginitalea biformata HTCC2501]
MPRKSEKGYNYETIPAHLFIRLLQRDEAVAHRVVGAGAWRRIKERWLASREDEKGDQLLEARRRYLLESCKHGKVQLLIRWVTSAPEDKQKELFEALRISWSDDKKARGQQLKKLLNKHKELVKKAKRQLEALEKPEEEGEEPKFTMDDYDRSMASLELMGFHVEDYKTIPLGRYEAINSVARKRLDAQKEAKENG